MHVLVTGASGFSGAVISAELLARGFIVTAVTGKNKNRLPINSEFNKSLNIISTDISQGFEIPEGINSIIHVAARSPWIGVSVADMVRDNVIATQNLISSAVKNGVSKFIYFSSLSVHGNIEVEVVDQKTPILDPGVYGLTKRLCEQMLQAAAGPAMSCMAMRLPGIIGPSSVRNWLSTTYEKAKRGEDIFVYDKKAMFNNAVHINDLAAFVGNLLTLSWTGYDFGPLGASEQIKAGEVAQILSDAGGGKSAIYEDNSPKRSYTISSDWAQRHYGYSPMGTEKMIRQFCLENS